MITFTFVMTGTKYRPKHVNALVSALKQYYPASSYVCYTDQPESAELSDDILRVAIDPRLHLPGVWNKLALFREVRPEFNNVVYFDLDTIIRKDPTPWIEKIDWNKLTMVDCHWKPKSIVNLTNYDVTINSSMMAWNMNCQPDLTEIWSYFFNSGLRDYFVKKYVGMDRYLVHEVFNWTLIHQDTFPTDMIRSHKYESRGKDAPVVTFEEVDFDTIDPAKIA